MGILSFLAHFWVCQITPFGTPISSPHVVHWRPHIFMPIRSPDLLPSLALRYVSGAAFYFISHRLNLGCLSHPWDLPKFCILQHFRGPLAKHRNFCKNRTFRESI